MRRILRGMTEAEHRELAALLFVADDALLRVEIINCFATSTRVYRAFKTLQRALGAYRNALDNDADAVSEGRVSYFGKQLEATDFGARVHRLCDSIKDRQKKERERG